LPTIVPWTFNLVHFVQYRKVPVLFLLLFKMWLLETSTFRLHEYTGSEVPPYAILSHTWAEDEVLFHEIQQPFELVPGKAGFEKIRRFCMLAREHTYNYAWIDTVCIDKRSSAELTETINSMFKWYQNASLCIIYLADVPAFHDGGNEDAVGAQRDIFKSSRWFTRGWTLQELLASKHRRFFASDWTEIKNLGPNVDILRICSKVTGISADALYHKRPLAKFCVAERMSWAAYRQTTRLEDRAYSLMGIFGVNMAILYGEGLRGAFRRLQREIMRALFDQTIFAWRGNYQSSGLLTYNPADFANTPKLGLWAPAMLTPTSTTNIGVSIRACISKNVSDLADGVFRVALQCDLKTDEGWMLLFIRLQLIPQAYCYLNGKRCPAFRRVGCDIWDLIPRMNETEFWEGDILILEDEQFDLVMTSIDEDWSRREEGNWGSSTQLMYSG
jgi:hypothetical protein